MIPCRISAYVAPPPLPTGAILYLPFDGDEGSTSYPDLSGLNQTQTVVGTGASPPITGTGAAIGQCVNMKPNATYISSTGIITHTQWTVALFFTIDGTLPTHAFEYLWSQSFAGFNNHAYFSYKSSTDEYGVRVTLNGQGGNTIYFPRTRTTPIHLEIAKTDGIADAGWWLDGVAQSNIFTGSIQPGATATLIGARLTTDTDGSCDGKIDNLIITSGTNIHAVDSGDFTPPTQPYTI